jgi:hypothetical protein
MHTHVISGIDSRFAVVTPSLTGILQMNLWGRYSSNYFSATGGDLTFIGSLSSVLIEFVIRNTCS